MNNLNKLLVETWNFYRGNLWGICTVIMPFIVPLTILLSVLGYYSEGEPTASFWAAYMLGVVVYPVYQGAMILYFSSVLTGKYLRPGQYYLLAIKFWLPMMVLNICSSVALAIGFMLLILPGLIVMGRIAYAEFYCIFQDKGGVEAFSESWKATEEKQWLLIGGMIAIFAFTSLPIYGIEFVLEHTELANPLFTFVLEIIHSLLMPLFTIFAFRLYTLQVDGMNHSGRQDIVDAG